MKNKFYLMLLAFFLTFSFIAGSSVANAYYGPVHCRWISGHWGHYGRWYPARKVCWTGGYYHHCHWVGGYRSHGYWYNGHRVCR